MEEQREKVSKNRTKKKQSMKRDSVEKLFFSSKRFIDAKPLKVHGLETLRRILFENIVALKIQFAILSQMKKTDLASRYSMEKIIQDLQKTRKIKLKNGKE